MVAYSHQVAEMIRHAMLDLGGIRTIPEVYSWITSHYPGDHVKQISVSTSMSDLSLNGPPSSLYQANQKFLNRVDRGRYRMADQADVPKEMLSPSPAIRHEPIPSRLKIAIEKGSSASGLATEGPNFLILSSQNIVELWSKEVLQFEPKKARNPIYQVALKQELGNAIDGLDSNVGKTLYACYATELQEAAWAQNQTDIENILFYNVGMGHFSKFTDHNLVFEWTLEKPSYRYAYPRKLSDENSKLFKHRYFYAVQDDFLRRWKRESPIATFSSTRPNRPLDEYTPFFANSGDKRMPDHFWYALKKGGMNILERNITANEKLGIRIELAVPQSELSWSGSNIMKPLLDGILSALHAQKEDTPNDRADRVANIVERLHLIYPRNDDIGLAREVERFLYDQTHAVLGSIELVRFRKERKSIQWTPFDKNIVHAEIQLSLSAKFPSFSGELFMVSPAQ